MATKTCPSPDELLAFQLGNLPEAVLDEVADHLESCHECEQQARQTDTRLDPFLSALRDGTLAEGAHQARPEAPDNWPKLKGYEILGVLGRGGMAVVYKARQVELNRIVALKMILADATASADELARFRNEAEAAARLHHPNLVQIYEIGRQEGRLFLALEYVEGGSLKEQLAGKPQPAHAAAELVETLARAMHYAHERGILHRDLKPANILRNQAGVVKITDFGLAKQLDGGMHVTQTGVLAGTPAYMAPEQIDGPSTELRMTVDVYGLGVILYELLLGHVPFEAATSLATLSLVRSQEAVMPAHLPRDLQTICMKCLQKEPHRRYGSALELAKDLRRFRNGEAIHARPVSATERFAKWCRRQPMVAGLLAVVIVSTFLGVFGILLGWQGAVEERRKAEDNEKQAIAARNDAQQARADAERALQALKDEQAIKRQRGQKSAPLFLQDAKRSGGNRQLDYALAQVDIALEYDPELIEARLVKGQLLIVKRDFANAADELKQYLARHHSDMDARRLLALCTADRGVQPVAFAEVFNRQKQYGLAAQMEQDSERLLQIYRAQIDRAWQFGGHDLRYVDGKLDLKLENRPQVTELSPLQGVPIEVLSVNGCPVRDLTPLKDMPLAELSIAGTQVKDLTPLSGMRLRILHIAGTPVEDLRPIADMPIEVLKIFACTKLKDLGPLRGMNIRVLEMSRCSEVRDLSPLGDLPLTALYLGYTQAPDLSPIRKLKLTHLDLSFRGRQEDLLLIQGMPMKHLGLNRCGAITDLTPLAGMQLEAIELPPQVERGMAVLRQMKTLTMINLQPAAEFWKKVDAVRYRD